MRQQPSSDHEIHTASRGQQIVQGRGVPSDGSSSVSSNSSLVSEQSATTDSLKSLSEALTTKVEEPKQPRLRRCRVRGCPNPHCSLITHQRYNPKHYAKGETHLKGAASTILKNLHPVHRDLRILRDNLDGLPPLPIDDQLNPSFRALFHRFFDTVFEPLANTFRGPAVANMTEYKSRMLTVALENKAYCMALVSHADTDVSLINGVTQETENALALYTKSLTAFRSQLVSVHQTRDPFLIEMGLLIVCMLCVHDMAYCRDKAVMMHWDGLQRLVVLRGGLHCVTISLAYVVAVDRSTAVYFNQMPVFINATDQLLNINWETWSKYGSAFSNLQRANTNICDAKVLDHCIQTSRLMEIWERSKRINGTQNDNATFIASTSSEFAFYVRDRVDEQFAVLHAKWSNDSSMTRCLLWASRIIEYRFTWANYFPVLTIRLCEELIQILQQPHLSTYWSTQPEVIVWMLFAALVIPSKFEGRGWAISRLRNLLDDKYVQKPWPEMWWSMELDNLRTFIWCDFPSWGQRVSNVCIELQRGSHRVHSLTEQSQTKKL